MEEQKILVGKSRLNGTILRTVKEIGHIQKQHQSVLTDFVRTASSFSKILGRFIHPAQIETPKKPAYIILLDFPEQYLKYVHGGTTGLAERYTGKPFNKIMPELLKDVGNCDGAIIVDDTGTVVRVGAQLISLDTRKLTKERKKEYGKNENPSALFGFGSQVGTRHTSALVATHKYPGIKAITLSEESDDVRVYKKGRIIASTHPKDRVHGLKRIPKQRTTSFFTRLAASVL